MLNNKISDTYTEAKLSAALEPVLNRLGIQADGVFDNGELIPNVTIEHAVGLEGETLPGFLAAYTVFDEIDQQYTSAWVVNPETKAYRLDTLLQVRLSVPGTDAEASRRFELVMTYIRKGLLKQAIQTLGELILLQNSKEGA